jgi:hypothetical protein
LSETFARVPRALVEQASGFALGEGLVAGHFTACPRLFRSGERRTPEGGRHVPTTWAREPPERNGEGVRATFVPAPRPEAIPPDVGDDHG